MREIHYSSAGPLSTSSDFFILKQDSGLHGSESRNIRRLSQSIHFSGRVAEKSFEPLVLLFSCEDFFDDPKIR
jgi:hypothetical protein